MLNHHIRRFTTTTTHQHFQQTLTHHLKNNNLTAALTLFYNNPNTPKTHQTYADIFHACARLNSISHGLNLHQHMIKTHQQNQIKPTLYISNHLINMYAKCGFLENARKVFDEMPERNIVTWSVLVSGYCQFGCFEEGFRLFCEMVKVLRPNEFAYASVLSCCGLEDGRQVHAHAMKTCFDGFTYVGNALVKMYSSGEGVREAWRVFEWLEFRNIVTWNSMVAAFQSGGKWEDGLRLFTLMRREWDIGFDRATLLTVLSSLMMVKDNGSDVIGLCLKYCSQVHCLAIKTWFITEIGVITALAKAYADLGAEMSDLYRLFMETSGMRDIVSWTAFITIFAQHDPEESLLMFSKLFQEGFSPDRHTYSIVLKVCAGLVTDRHTLVVHSQILKYGFENDTVLANALVHAYGRSGSVLESSKVFDSMLIKDIVSWNSMIKIYGLHGQPKEALKCFDEMNIQPDSTTFVALLSACSHTGMVKEGTKLFETMSKTYGIAPQLDHYACMVDIFGRSGQTLEAQKLINEMPIEPDSVILSVLGFNI
ncbi:pentatricopeptide repeat-containing protein [Tanacetum coccineum]